VDAVRIAIPEDVPPESLQLGMSGTATVFAMKPVSKISFNRIISVLVLIESEPSEPFTFIPSLHHPTRRHK